MSIRKKTLRKKTLRKRTLRNRNLRKKTLRKKTLRNRRGGEGKCTGEATLECPNYTKHAGTCVYDYADCNYNYILDK